MTQKSCSLLRNTAMVLLGSALGFRDCAIETLNALVSQGVLQTIAKGQLLTEQGAPHKSLILVVRGSLEASTLRPDGHRHLNAILQAGDVLGMIGLIDGLGHVHDLRGHEAPTVVMLFSSALIKALRLSDPALGRALELQIAFRSRLMYERMSADHSLTLESRLARLLLTLGALYGRKVGAEDGVQLAMKLSQSDLADWLGVSRQRVNAAIAHLKGKNLIAARYSTVCLLNQEGLRQLST